MKKVIIFALLFIIILPCFSAEEPTGAVSSPNFNVVLQRSGITEYYFTEFGNSTRLERVIFSNIYQEDGMYKSDAYLGFHYQIFENGNYTINIYFNPKDNAHMLVKTDDMSAGYNPAIYYETRTENSNSDPTQLPAENANNNVITIKHENISENTGESGDIDIALVLESEAGFNKGQYNGEIAVYVISS